MKTTSPKSDIRTNPPEMMTVKETAEFLACSTRALANYVNRGILPSIKLGRRVLFSRTKLYEALAKLESNA